MILDRLNNLGKLVAIVTLLLTGTAAGAQTSEKNWTQGTATSADGTKIAYYVAGERRQGLTPLLVISGGPGSDHRYMRVGGSFDLLAEDRQVVMFDQRGTSRSGAVTGAPRLAQWAEDVEAVRAAVGADRFSILGHSFGGIVAMAYAEKFRQHIASIIFANSTAASIAETENSLRQTFPDRIDEWQSRRAALPPRFKASAIDVFTSMEFVDLERLEVFLAAIADYTYNIEVNNALRRDMADLDFSEVVASFAFPVLVLHGRYDPVITPSTAWKLHRQIPNSQLTILAATGHLPFAEIPEVFVETVQRFLSGVDQ